MGVGGQHHAPAALPPEKTRYPLYRRLGVPQGRYGRVRKISPSPGFDPRMVQPVASRYTDWAIAAPKVSSNVLKLNKEKLPSLLLIFFIFSRLANLIFCFTTPCSVMSDYQHFRRTPVFFFTVEVWGRNFLQEVLNHIKSSLPQFKSPHSKSMT